MTQTDRPEHDYDVVILGAGAGGMTAALVAAIEGRRTLLIEKSDQVGGTTAFSSGTLWIPDNPEAREHLGTDDGAAALQYLDALVGDRTDRALREAFVGGGPEMLRYLAAHTDLRFRAYPRQPDYRPELPGAALGWRALEPPAFDGRTLGPAFDRVRWPIPELMLFGGMMVTRAEAARLMRVGRSIDSLVLGARLMSRFVADRLRYRRGTRLVLGNALAARLFWNLLDRHVPVWFGTTTTRLLTGGGRVEGIVVIRDGQEAVVHASSVVLAGGGFPASPDMRRQYLPGPVPEHTSAYAGCTGDTLVLAQQAGAALGPESIDNALWFPGSVDTRRDGSVAVYPHIILDRGKPGLVAVNAAGHRFTDEAAPYHDFTRAMYESNRTVPTIPAWLVCDRRFLWKYGLGLIRPYTLVLRGFERRGYLKSSRTIEGLARAIGVDPAGLLTTVRDHNLAAAMGHDAEFGKGGNAYDRASGDAAHGPNPCLGPIRNRPYFAVAVVPTPLGTSLGLLTDGSARVLDPAGRPIQGMYACGNDMHSVFGGEYPGAGAQLGLALTFGYLAGKHAAGTN
jgi:hypothetical protein